ncbi:hypothetical protein [Gracilinema caldarium]|uniref:hypothetical protein n=1 Tax=Gracilinema caldarium TaxID=215591 RepID=UPI0026EF5987|nr:hypothetical protein [Gracilinema caldarium]
MVKKKLYIFIGSAFATSLIYLMVAAKPISPEFTLKTLWTLNLDDTSPRTAQSETIKEAPIPFVLGNLYGYISPDGALIDKRSLQQNHLISITPKLVSVINPIPDTITIESPASHTAILVKDASGYPFLVQDRIFLIGKDQDSISFISDSGTVRWNYCVSSPITALACNVGNILIGTLDGNLYLLNSEGELIYTFQPGGSRLSIILGVALASDSSKIALISGIDKQRFILLGKAGQTYKVIHHQFLNTDYRRQVIIKFAQNNQYVLFEGKANLSVFDGLKKRMYEIPIDKPIQAIEAIEKTNKVFVMAGAENQKQLIALSLPNKKLLTSSFVSPESFIYSYADQLILGSGSVITSFIVEK